jgi:hypothetical protein
MLLAPEHSRELNNSSFRKNIQLGHSIIVFVILFSNEFLMNKKYCLLSKNDYFIGLVFVQSIYEMSF